MRLAAFTALLLLASPAAAATRNFAITSFDRIRVDGPYQVALRTGTAPFARAHGSQSALDGLAIKVEGRTLVVRAGLGTNWGGYPGQNRGPVTVELGTHELSSAWLNGAGALAIDRVKGLSFDLAVNGAGVMRIDSVDVDLLKASLTGAASARLAGRAAKLTASARGSSTLDAEGLRAQDSVIVADGPALIRASVTGTAKVDAFGLASVVLAGGPSCIVTAKGSSSVTGCR